MGSLIKKTSKSGGEMIEIFNHLFLYAIIDTERGVEVDELRKIMGLGNGYKVIKIEESKEDKVKAKYIYVETRSIKCKCPKCGKYTKSIHDRLRPVKLKYVKAFEQITYVMLNKKRFICHGCKYKFTEPVTIQGENKNISNKTVQKILIDLRSYNLSLKYIAKENNVSDNTVRNILKESMANYPEHIKNLPSVISFDEFKADTNEGKYAFVLNNPIHKKVLDILPNRKKEYLMQYFTYCNNRHSVEYVISDMYEPYLLVTQTMFPKAKYVVDPFHYTRYIMDALDKVRIRLQDNYGYNSYEYKMLKNKKNISLLRQYSNDIDWFTYTKRYKNKHMVEILKYDLREKILNISEEYKIAYQLKELFLDITHHATYEDVEKQLLNWISIVREQNIEEMIEASNTIENWLEYICNSFIDKRFSNGYTEGMNNKIKVIKRVGFGYKDFAFFRIRLLYILNDKNSKKSKK